MNIEARNHLFAVIDRCIKAYRGWIEAGQSAIHIEDEIFAAFGELASEGAGYRKEAGLLFRTAYEFVRVYGQLQSAIAGGRQDGAMPEAEFWQVWDSLEDMRIGSQRIHAPGLESLAELLALPRRPTDMQIADMYGWKHPVTGGWDTERVRREISLPPEKRTIPENPEQERFNNDHAERVSIAEGFRVRRNNRIRLETTPAPESFATLLTQPGITADQIAEMKQCGIPAVYAEADELGLPRPPRRDGRRPMVADDDSDPSDSTPGGEAAGSTPPKPSRPVNRGRKTPANASAGKHHPTGDGAGQNASAEESEAIATEIAGYRQSGWNDDDIRGLMVDRPQDAVEKALTAVSA